MMGLLQVKKSDGSWLLGLQYWVIGKLIIKFFNNYKYVYFKM